MRLSDFQLFCILYIQAGSFSAVEVNMFYSSIIPFLITAALALPTNELLSTTRPNSFRLPLQRRVEGAVISDNLGPVWTSTILVGNQEIRMLIDTGSADL